MKTLRLFAAALVLCVASAKCSEDKLTHEIVAKTYIQYLIQFNALLADVNDVATAKATEPKLRALGVKMRDLAKRGDALGDMSPEEVNMMETTYEARIEAETERLSSHLERLDAMPGVQEIIAAVVGDIVGSLGDEAPLTQEAVIREQIELTRELNAILASVTDVASAKAARAKVEAWARKMAGLTKKVNSLRNVPKEEDAKNRANFDAQVNAEIETMTKHFERFSKDPEIHAIMQEIIGSAKGNLE